MNAFAGTLAIRKRGECGKRAKDSCVGITIGNPNFGWSNIAITGQRGNPRQRDRCRPVAHILPFRSSLPVAADGDHNDVRLELLERVIAESYTINSPGRKVLYDNVAFLD